MAERIHKLQPDRTIALRGFDDLGASAALHSATPNSFRVSGTFRDPGDFAVLMLWDADNFYEHPRLKYLPDTDFTGMRLQFDVHYSGLMPLDSPKFPTIDWPSLNVVQARDANCPSDPPPQAESEYPYIKPVSYRLLEHAVRIGGTYSKAQASFTLVDDGLRQYDSLTLFFEDIAFPSLVLPKEWAFLCLGKGTPGHQHTVRVVSTDYTYVEKQGDTNTDVALGVIAALSACPRIRAQQDPGAANQVNVSAILDDGVGFSVNAFGTACPYSLYGWGVNTTAADLAWKINTKDYSRKAFPLRATAQDNVLTITAELPGDHGNLLSMYAVWKNPGLRCTEHEAHFSGGSSDSTWRVTMDFGSATGVPLTRIRQMWLTFAPNLAIGASYADTEWEATFTNWTVTGEAKWLAVAGPGSVRIEDTDSWCKYTGEWALDTGFYSEGFARVATAAGSSVAVKYACSAVHDLYLGTTIGSGGGRIAASLDGQAIPGALSCYLNVVPFNTRLLLKQQIPAGEHTVTLTKLSGASYAFDFLEAAVRSDIPAALPANASVSPALDYSTDHTWKLPPARIHWSFDQLGFAAPMNEYIGVFWWNQRKRVNGQMPWQSVTFNGPFAENDVIELRLEAPKPDNSHFKFQKTVVAADSGADIAAQLAGYLNGYSVGVWARAEGAKLTITSRSAKPAYRFPFGIRVGQGAESGDSRFTMGSGSLEEGWAGTWQVDPAQSPPINRGARDWHADMFGECKRRNREITVACSMELVNPPDGFGARFFDGTVVRTDVGFGELASTHCHFGPAMRSYQKSVYRTLAGLMSAEGLTPSLQFGEFLWWFFGWYVRKPQIRVDAGMAYYDPDTGADAQTKLGHALNRFLTPDDPPDGADAMFLRNRLRDHVAELSADILAAYPDAVLELLFPYDVNHPKPEGIHNLGGKLNRFVNLPVEWECRATAPFHRIKTEALDFGAWNRNLDLAKTAFELPLQLGWEASSVRHLVPIFRPGYAWQKEVDMALAKGIPVVNLWAWDHICLYNLPVVAPSKGRSVQIGG